MPRKTQYGKFILSAGEIGAYTVCPEAWRLKELVRAKALRNESVDQGTKLHREWSEKYDEAAYLARSAKLVFLLLIAAIAIYSILQY